MGPKSNGSPGCHPVGQTGCMFCINCGSTSDDTVCRICGSRATDVVFDSVTPILAGWWGRVGATLLDSVILVLPTLVLVLLLGNLFGEIAAIAAEASYLIILQTQPDGQTLGNRMVQTRVRDALTGHVITRRQAAIRWVVVAVYAVLVTLPSTGSHSFTVSVSVLAVADCLYPLFNARKQTIHDRIAHTIVVRT